ncbi:phospholipase D delta isoform X2 [Elaeis guineensis]|uniref:Phospholipase D n=1 Tax=Elaeis guineensis var. tenera TaxID=51953 RepID=A0A8N4IBP9_ELAGV|nr:phospholipase D delta [Elaeis guineensis]XP_029118260.1 phospholipase D delta [Elaeis guineensis]XP_029118261.1 phospholipase D delta [Elaeis guineensis]
MYSGSVRHSDSMGKRSPTDVDGVMFLHGDLDIWILEARSLPNMDVFSDRMIKCFTVYGTCTTPCGKADKHKDKLKDKHKDRHKSMHKIITSDPYVSVCVAGATIAQTRVIPNSEDPKWDEHFCVPVAHPVSKIEFQVKDNDVFGAQLIGVAAIPVDKILPGVTVSGWFPVVGPYGNPMKPYPELHLSLQFRPMEDNPLYKDGVGAGPEYLGVPNAYFPLRTGGNITLYQDAHVPDNMLPTIPLDGGKTYEHNKCWEDICHAILEAHHLIYIVGWSIYHSVKLVREPTRPLPNGGELSLGELLKYKTQEGVRVVMLIWDDKTSHDKFYLKTDGVMHTHDEETRKFFKHSSVHCVLAPRYASNKLSIFKQQVVGTLFTHHQKCVIVDTQALGNNRKITAFIGGLDLCDGRYDTPEHRLFQNLDSVFVKDFHNPTFPVNSYGPRQPWHDLHCKIEGPAAHDILTNFEQRWRKATKWRDFRFSKVTHWHDDALIKIDRISWIITPFSDKSNTNVSDEQNPENWHVQIFRSIDSGSVRGFPKLVQEAESKNLVCAKNLKIDKSIHSAYVKAIRSAQHFIYVENQYFIGSSYCWPSYKNAGADNLIPMELALKIVSKIKARERFSVYIVIPMWPEGIPTAAAMQEILFWQGQTMAMMYKFVGEALQEENLSEKYHPQDYLNFYCLGKREAPKENPSSPKVSGDNSALRSAQKSRRFMIYVHSKGMIVDDEYVIIGSANINQRSLEGSRDTEIAMGAYQPHYKWAGKCNHPHGQVYGYRMSLWAEHLGMVEDCFREPQSLECIRHVNRLAEDNWKSYVAPEIQEMKGHLMRYPIKVERDGKIGPLPGHECFPDVGGKVLGAQSTLPDVLTT